VRRNEAPVAITSKRYHEVHRADPNAAIESLFAEWRNLQPDEDWSRFLNTAPRENLKLLSRNSLKTLSLDDLTKVVFNTHSAREHARQARKSDLGDENIVSTQDERCRLLAQFWLRQRTTKNRGVHEVLDYVIWGDDVNPSVASRLWQAIHDPAWKIRRLGISILGELIGNARPERYPPRNGRVSKTLHALGFDGVDS
jgi:hypothetical protein